MRCACNKSSRTRFRGFFKQCFCFWHSYWWPCRLLVCHQIKHWQSNKGQQQYCNLDKKWDRTHSEALSFLCLCRRKKERSNYKGRVKQWTKTVAFMDPLLYSNQLWLESLFPDTEFGPWNTSKSPVNIVGSNMFVNQATSPLTTQSSSIPINHQDTLGNIRTDAAADNSTLLPSSKNVIFSTIPAWGKHRIKQSAYDSRPL